MVVVSDVPIFQIGKGASSWKFVCYRWKLAELGVHRHLTRHGHHAVPVEFELPVLVSVYPEPEEIAVGLGVKDIEQLLVLDGRDRVRPSRW